MSLVLTGLSPHPPLLVPEIGQESLEKVLDSQTALRDLCRAFVEKKPETIVFITPHGPFRPDAVSVLVCDEIDVAFQQFDWRCSLQGDRELAELICRETGRAGFPTHRYSTFDSYHLYFSRGLDHATMVPLYYLREAGDRSRIVVISVAYWSHREHYEFGKAVKRAVEASGRRVAVMASGDLSHRLIPQAPAGYEPRGREFDLGMVRCLEEMDVAGVLSLDDDFIERIGECGLRPISTLLGILEGKKVSSRVLSYEGPFGVGYCVALLEPGGDAPDEAATVERADEPVQEADVDEMLGLARAAVESYVTTGAVPDAPVPLSRGLEQRAGAFVCIKAGGRLRGCIGTLGPTQVNLATELIHNAVSAATRDPRFSPVTEGELAGLTYSVDVLHEPEVVTSLDELDCQTYGVIVRSGSRSGVLLPKLEGVDTVEEQLAIARQKAGISERDAHQEISRFRVTRYERKKD